MSRTGAYVSLGSNLPPEDPRYPPISSRPEGYKTPTVCDQAPEPVNQPLALNPPQGYGATCTTLNSFQPSSLANRSPQGGASIKPVVEVVPAPENRKGDRVCVQAPDGRRNVIDSLPTEQYQQQVPHNQFPVVYYDQQPTLHQQQTQEQPRKPIKTSKKFDTKTVDDNQYYISICLCIVLTLVCNPFAIICCIPAFYYGSKAAEESDYDTALSHHRKAQYLNAGGFGCILLAATFFFIVVLFGIIGVMVYLEK